MRRLVSLLTVGMLVAACGGATTGGGGGAGGTQGAGLPTDAGGGGGDGASGGRPSGARVRAVNVYNDGTGAPGSIDVYAAPWVLEGAKPLLSVPYGTATDFFDPTVADDQGDMFLSFYRHGQTGNGNELISQTETLKGGEVITFMLMSDAEKADDGTPKLFLQALFHGPSDSFYDATPAPGQGVLLVNMHGTSGIVKATDGTSWFLSRGQGCMKAIGDDQYTTTAAGPGDGTRYALDPGDYSFSLNPVASDAAADCTTPPLISGLKVSLVADQTTLLVVYAASATDIRSMVLSLAK